MTIIQFYHTLLPLEIIGSHELWSLNRQKIPVVTSQVITALMSQGVKSWFSVSGMDLCGDDGMATSTVRWSCFEPMLEVSINGCTPIAGCFFYWKILLKEMIWGYPYFREPPYIYIMLYVCVDCVDTLTIIIYIIIYTIIYNYIYT